MFGVASTVLDIIGRQVTALSNEVKAAVPKSVGPERSLAENVKEYDTALRNATVYLFTRPVDGRNDEVEEFRHWSLVFEFEDNSVRFVEGNEHNNQLMAFYYKESPRKEGKYYELGVIKTSPAIVREIAVKNKLNYSSYCFAINNCQEWIKEYALQLDDDEILRNIKNFSTLREARPLFAYTASSSARSWNASSSGSSF